jgi:Uma2 family endonuclease
MIEYLTIVNDDDLSESLVEEPKSEYGFTYADYLAWKFKERIELIKGKVFKMSPAPLVSHQTIVANINNYIAERVKKNPCKVLFSPVDVKLIGRPFRRIVKDDEIYTVVQPDVIVVCDPEKLADVRSITGAPEMVVEVLSLGNTKQKQNIN